MGLIGYLNEDAWKLLDVFGELLTHRPYDKEADAQEITGAFEETEPERDMTSGDENHRFGWLMIPDSVADVSTKSVWIIRNERWETERMGTPDVGTLKLWLSRLDDGKRTKPRRKY